MASAGKEEISMRDSVEERSTHDMDIVELLLAYIRRWKLLVLCFVIVAGIAYMYTYFFVTPTYRTSASICVYNNKMTEDMGSITSSDLSASNYLVNTYVNIVKSDRVLQKLSEKLISDALASEGQLSEEQLQKRTQELKSQYSIGKLSGAISTEHQEKTILFKVYVVHVDPQEAVTIANAAASVIPTEIAGLVEGTSAQVIDYARVPGGAYSPNYSRNALIGGVAGLVLAIVGLTIAFMRDTRIKDENDLMDVFQLPILGRIPDVDYAPTRNRYGYGKAKTSADMEETEE